MSNVFPLSTEPTLLLFLLCKTSLIKVSSLIVLIFYAALCISPSKGFPRIFRKLVSRYSKEAVVSDSPQSCSLILTWFTSRKRMLCLSLAKKIQTISWKNLELENVFLYN